MTYQMRERIWKIAIIISVCISAAMLIYKIIYVHDRKIAKEQTTLITSEVFTKTLERGRVICIDSIAYLSFKEDGYIVNVPLYVSNTGYRLQCNQIK